MRPPDETTEIEWCGLTVTVREWCDPADFPWDGDEELPENAEGWDLLCEVEVARYEHTFTARDSLVGNWLVPNADGIAWLKEQAAHVREQALEGLLEAIETDAGQAPILKAAALQRAARALLHTIAKE